MAKKLFLILCFPIYFTCMGQTPGYMGKKTTLGYGYYINPAITAAILDYGTKVVNIQHAFFVERALKRGLLIGASMRLYKSTYNNTGLVDAPSFCSNGTQSSSNSNRETGGSIHIKAKNYELYFKLFKWGYVAPWGRYFLIGLTLNTRESSYDPDEMNLAYKDKQTGKQIIFNDFGATVQNYKYPDLMIGTGNSRIVAKRIAIDYGYNIHVVALTMAVLDAPDEYVPIPEKYIQTNSGMRVRGINRINFFVKLGYLF